MDKINQAILACLKANSRRSWQEIGKQVFLSGQAVAARVQQLEDHGLISAYTIRQTKIERHFITMFMEVAQFEPFERFLQQEPQVEAAYKVTGEGCYQLIFTPDNPQSLEPFLNSLLKYGKYRVSSAIRCVK